MYVFDTSSFSVIFKSFYPARFPTLWSLLNDLVKSGKVFSVHEVFNEIESRNKEALQWVKDNKSIFQIPSQEEAEFIKDIFSAKNGHFKNIIGKDKILKGGFCADPFLIASAKIKNSCVVTEESNNGSTGSKIPNICDHFGISCLNLEKFMEKENWRF
jgi:hypothetical protein